MLRLNKKQKTGVVILSVLISLMIIFIVLSNNATPLLLNNAEARVKEIVTRIANECIRTTASSSAEYQDLVNIVRDNEGKMAYMTANTYKLNTIASDVATSIQQRLEGMQNQTIDIRLGALLGSDILSNSGPKIGIKIVPVGNVITEFISEFMTAGINQTRHVIYLIVKSEIKLVLPSGTSTFTVKSQVSISDSIIVGLVPNSYVNVQDTDQMLNLVPIE